MVREKTPVWLITGCSTGIGRELAKAVLARGWRAVVTARKVDQVQDLVEAGGDNAFAVKLDVTRPDEVAEAIGQAETHFGQIDVLVNNAGYGYLAAVEEGEDEAVRRLFETNFFGLVQATNQVLPGMRKRRSGSIINISSIGGMVGFGATGYYHATKFAVEGLSESLAIEVKPLGIKVMVVEPGPFRTDWSGRSIVESRTVIDDYAETAGKRRQQTHERSGKQQGDPARAAQAILEAINANEVPLHLVLGKPGWELVTRKLEETLEQVNAWKDVAFSADFPEGQ